MSGTVTRVTSIVDTSRSLTGTPHSHCEPWTFLFFRAPDEDRDDRCTNLQRANESWVVTKSQVSPEPQQYWWCRWRRTRQTNNLPLSAFTPRTLFLWLFGFLCLIEITIVHHLVTFLNCRLLGNWVRMPRDSLTCDMKLGLWGWFWWENLWPYLLRAVLFPAVRRASLIWFFSRWWKLGLWAGRWRSAILHFKSR